MHFENCRENAVGRAECLPRRTWHLQASLVCHTVWVHPGGEHRAGRGVLACVTSVGSMHRHHLAHKRVSTVMQALECGTEQDFRGQGSGGKAPAGEPQWARAGDGPPAQRPPCLPLSPGSFIFREGAAGN